MAVRPGELFLVEDAGGVPDVLERETPRELVDRQQLVVAARRPADQRKVVHQRLGQISLRAELADRRRAVPLRQRRVIGPHHHRQMRKGGRRKPERLVQQNLPRRVRDVILSSNHVRHLHQRIVDDHGEVVRRTAVGAHDHRIADDVGLKADLASNRVREDDVAIVGDAKADRGALAGGRALGILPLRQPPAGAGIARRPSGGEGLLTLCLELRRRAEAVVRSVGAEQLLRVRLIEMQPLGLPVRAARSADVGPLVPVEAEPPQVAEDRRLRLARRALGVGVLDAQDERAALPAGEQPVEERRTGVPHVQLTCRAWREADSHN